jgi:hypothetical protein
MSKRLTSDIADKQNRLLRPRLRLNRKSAQESLPLSALPANQNFLMLIELNLQLRQSALAGLYNIRTTGKPDAGWLAQRTASRCLIEAVSLCCYKHGAYVGGCAMVYVLGRP